MVTKIFWPWISQDSALDPKCKQSFSVGQGVHKIMFARRTWYWDVIKTRSNLCLSINNEATDTRALISSNTAEHRCSNNHTSNKKSKEIKSLCLKDYSKGGILFCTTEEQESIGGVKYWEGGRRPVRFWRTCSACSNRGIGTPLGAFRLMRIEINPWGQGGAPWPCAPMWCVTIKALDTSIFISFVPKILNVSRGQFGDR